MDHWSFGCSVKWACTVHDPKISLPTQAAWLGLRAICDHVIPYTTEMHFQPSAWRTVPVSRRTIRTLVVSWRGWRWHRFLHGGLSKQLKTINPGKTCEQSVNLQFSGQKICFLLSCIVSAFRLSLHSLSSLTGATRHSSGLGFGMPVPSYRGRRTAFSKLKGVKRLHTSSFNWSSIFVAQLRIQNAVLDGGMWITRSCVNCGDRILLELSLIGNKQNRSRNKEMLFILFFSFWLIVTHWVTFVWL